MSRSINPTGDRDEALRLIEDAKAAIATGDPSCAIWRLLDAAGLAAGLCPDNTPIRGLSALNCTGRGLYLAKLVTPATTLRTEMFED